MIFIEIYPKICEGLLSNHSSRNLKRLGVLDIITTRNIHAPLEGDLIQQISEEQKNNAKNEFNDWVTNNTDFTYYLKLHGSLDYYYDGMPLFITGENKSGRIAACPLTKFYSEVFENILKDSNCKLIIIGYGFQDEHINKIISDFLIKPCDDDEIHIVDNIDLKKFLENITGKIDICNLKNKLKSYHPNGLNARTLASFIEPNLLGLE
jgi:hypothetical protein